ncbi:MAG: GNAT family N-acetyltransferase [Anaeromyxobacter sp.]
MPAASQKSVVEGTAPAPAVRVLRAVRGNPLLERGLRALVLETRRPTPFNDPDVLSAFIDHDEYAGPGAEPHLLAAVDGERLVGFLPLRWTSARVAGITERKLEFFVTHDADRPDLVARPADEARCARAFREALLATRGWSVLELANLEPCSALLPADGERIPGVHARVRDGLPTAIIPTAQPDLAAWYGALKKGWKHTVARLGRRFLSAGTVELVTCRDPRGRGPLLELYLDVERRSWKREHGVARHPARLALHRELCRPDQALALSFQLLLLDGAAVSGFVFGEYAGTLYGFEICYDAAFQALGPGNLMSLLSAGEAIARGKPSLNLFADYAYYKGNWGAEVLPTRTLQLFRRGSVHWAKAHLGDLRRALSRGEGGEGRQNPVKAQVDEAREAGPEKPEAKAEPAAPDRAAERALTGRILAELEAAGVTLERVAGPALEAILPFAAAPEKKPPEQKPRPAQKPREKRPPPAKDGA